MDRVVVRAEFAPRSPRLLRYLDPAGFGAESVET